MRRASLMSQLRGVPITAVLAVTAAVATGSAALLDKVKAPSWLIVIATALVGFIGVAVAIDKVLADRRIKKEQREQKQRDEAAAASKWLSAVQDCLLWPPPPIRLVDPYEGLGVARPRLAHAGGVDVEDIPPYVERDVDRAAAKRLQSGGAVLIIGTPASGVTRTAYQAALSVPTSPLTLVAVKAGGLQTALADLEVISAIEPRTPLLLWLDRVNDHTTAGLTPSIVRRLRELSPGLRIVATVSSTEYEIWSTENRTFADLLGDPVLLKRLPSAEELERAEAVYPSQDFSEGIAAAFTVAAKLLKRLNGGYRNCRHESPGDDCALARAIVDVVVEWDLTDIRRQLPVGQLIELVGRRLADGQVVQAAHAAEVLEWGTTPVLGADSLLVVSSVHGGTEQSVGASPLIAEMHRADGQLPSEEIWTAALNSAVDAGDYDAVGRIGFRAHTEGDVSAAVRAWSKLPGVESPTMEWLQEAKAFSLASGKFAAAIPPVTRQLELVAALYGDDHPEVANVLVELGYVTRISGRPAEAEKLLERALRIQEREFGLDGNQLAKTLGRLAQTLLPLGRPAEARELFERKLRIEEREFGPNTTEAAITLAELGDVWRILGQPAKARKCVDQALLVQERELPSDHVEISHTLQSLGKIYAESGHFSEALELYEKALRIKEREFGAEHPELVHLLLDIARSWGDKGEIDKSRENCERALRVGLRNLGREHPRVGSALYTLGHCWQAAGQPEKACTFYERGLSILERVYGPESPQLFPALNGWGCAEQDLGQNYRALQLFERALKIQERVFGLDNLELMEVLINLGSLWNTMGRSEKARAQYTRALRIIRSHYPSGHPYISSIVRALRKIDPDTFVLDDGTIARQIKEEG